MNNHQAAEDNSVHSPFMQEMFAKQAAKKAAIVAPVVAAVAPGNGAGINLSKIRKPVVFLSDEQVSKDSTLSTPPEKNISEGNKDVEDLVARMRRQAVERKATTENKNRVVSNLSTPLTNIDSSVGNIKLKSVERFDTTSTEMFLRNEEAHSPSARSEVADFGGFSEEEETCSTEEEESFDDGENATDTNLSTPFDTTQKNNAGVDSVESFDTTQKNNAGVDSVESFDTTQKNNIGIHPDILTNECEIWHNPKGSGKAEWTIVSKSTFELDGKIERHKFQFNADKYLFNRKVNNLAGKLSEEWSLEIKGLATAAFARNQLVAIVERQEKIKFKEVLTPVNNEYAILELDETGEFPLKLTIHTPTALFEITKWADKRGQLKQGGKVRSVKAPIAIGYLNMFKLHAKLAEKIIRQQKTEEYYGAATPMIKAIKQAVQDEGVVIKDQVDKNTAMLGKIMFNLEDRVDAMQTRMDKMEEENKLMFEALQALLEKGNA